MKIMLAVAALAASVGASLPLDEPSNINYNAIARLDCGDGRGTAFWIDDTRLVTAAHVTSGRQCAIDGTPVQVTYENGDLDFAELRGPANPNHLRIDCRGFREGEIIHAVGFAEGLYRHTARLLATGFRGERPVDRGMRILLGPIIPGMSGGPMFDRRGKVIGINNRTSPIASWSRALRDTDLCRRS